MTSLASPSRLRRTRAAGPQPPPPPVEIAGVDSDDDEAGDGADADERRRIEADIRALLDGMQASFTAFSGSISGKMAAMDGKIAQLQGNVDALADAVADVDGELDAPEGALEPQAHDDAFAFGLEEQERTDVGADVLGEPSSPLELGGATAADAALDNGAPPNGDGVAEMAFP